MISTKKGGEELIYENFPVPSTAEVRCEIVCEQPIASRVIREAEIEVKMKEVSDRLKDAKLPRSMLMSPLSTANQTPVISTVSPGDVSPRTVIEAAVAGSLEGMDSVDSEEPTDGGSHVDTGAQDTPIDDDDDDDDDDDLQSRRVEACSRLQP